MNYDIFIDESGLFTETSLDPGDRIIEHKRRKKFPSQLAGVFAPEHTFTSDEAWRLFEPACNATGVMVGDEFHSTEIKSRGGGIFDQLVSETCRLLEATRVQPFRIVNRERVSFGDRKANYVNIVAELLLRVCRALDAGQSGELVLNIYQAGVKNSEYEEGDQPFWLQDDFQPTLQAAFQRTAIANGWANQSAKWRLGTFALRSGKKDKRLWLCDLISNASHDDFKTIGTAASVALKNTLGRFDFSLSINLVLQRVRDLAEREQFAAAVIELAEHSLSPWTGREARVAYERELEGIVPKLLGLSPMICVPQLQVILGWLRQTAENRERLRDAGAACEWVERKLLDSSLDYFAASSTGPGLSSWMRLGIATSALTACNHGADLGQGRAWSNKIDELVPKVAGRWEFASDLMQALITQSVHLADCFEHQNVVQKMSVVADYYRTLGSMFYDAYPDVFPRDVRSDLCGAALGTKLQSQTFLLLTGDADPDCIRATSDQAISQFSQPLDLQRQFQYRSEVEAIVGNWDDARGFLSKGIGCDDCDHQSLAIFIANMPESQRGFPLLHWTRIGGLAATKSDHTELGNFFKAWKASGLENSQWTLGEIPYYPVHGILRRLALVYSARHDAAKVTEVLRKLHNIVQEQRLALFQLIEAAAVLGSAGLEGAGGHEMAVQRLKGSKRDPSAKALLKALFERSKDSQPRIAAIAESWEILVDDVLAGSVESSTLITSAGVVGY